MSPSVPGAVCGRSESRTFLTSGFVGGALSLVLSASVKQGTTSLRWSATLVSSARAQASRPSTSPDGWIILGSMIVYGRVGVVLTVMVNAHFFTLV